ncbi:hypothetical protein BHE74_00015859 [Ensete ventricosum]|nr:hypothetical protein GW17_00038058 [Ensete ventricosum]RWW76079.1 hypothetical protein BHE74_00015859 [Ensete ventricosum]
MDRGLPASEEDLVEYVFHDIKGRRAGILKALTAGNSTFFALIFSRCDAIFTDCWFFSCVFPLQILRISTSNAILGISLALVFQSYVDMTLVTLQLMLLPMAVALNQMLLLAAKENLCLYGFPDEHWEVNLPADEVPPEIPEPVLGINFARDGTNKKDWLSLVAIHSDAWLNALASYFGGRFQFDRTQR